MEIQNNSSIISSSSGSKTSIESSPCHGYEKSLRVNSIDEARNLLLHHNVNAADAEGLTPLLHAIIQGELELVKYFTDRGACVHYQDPAGWSPLLWSIRCNHVHIANYLIREMSVDINMADYSGRTPLMCAICGYHTDLAKLLIYRGADIHMEDNDKDNALSLSTKAIMSSNKMRKGGGPTNKRVIHQDCDCARCESHSVIAALLVRRGAVDPFTGSYVSPKAKGNVSSILTNLFYSMCTNLDDNEAWSAADTGISEVYPSLSYLPKPNSNNDATKNSQPSGYDKKQFTETNKERTKSGDSTITKGSTCSSYTTADETLTLDEDNDIDDDNTINAALIVNDNWSLSYEVDAEDHDKENQQHEQVLFLQKMRRQSTFYGEDDDIYAGGSNRKYY